VRPADAVREAERQLAEAGVPTPRADAELIVAHTLGLSRSALYAAARPVEAEPLRALLDRRLQREPLAYVLGEWGFRRLTLAVDARVLVPRPETEMVVERCLTLLGELESPRVLDVGTGSGAIALAVADEHPGARVIGVDISAEALAVARANARRHGLDDRVAFRHGDLLAGLPGPFDLVASNPPYVRSQEIAGLEPEVREWEPRSALVAPGMTLELARLAFGVLAPGGRLVLECADGRAGEAREAFLRFGYEDVTVTRDLGGVERVVDGCRP
jgi:release factor glutamine methyltransferase